MRSKASSQKPTVAKVRREGSRPRKGRPRVVGSIRRIVECTSRYGGSALFGKKKQLGYARKTTVFRAFFRSRNATPHGRRRRYGHGAQTTFGYRCYLGTNRIRSRSFVPGMSPGYSPFMAAR